MTDQFIQNTDSNEQQNTQFVDQNNTGDSDINTSGDSQDGVNTNDPLYQISRMEKRIQDKDDYIKQLQDEAQRAREVAAELEEKMQTNFKKVDEALEKYNQRGDGQEEQPLDKDALVSEIEERLTERQKSAIRQQNYQKAQETLMSKFGSVDKVNEAVSQTAESMGLSTDRIREIAEESPTAFNRMMGIEQPKENTQQSVNRQTPAHSHSNQLSENDSGVVKDRAYFARLRRENPRLYWKAETQREFRKLFTDEK